MSKSADIPGPICSEKLCISMPREDANRLEDMVREAIVAGLRINASRISCAAIVLLAGVSAADRLALIDSYEAAARAAKTHSSSRRPARSTTVSMTVSRAEYETLLAMLHEVNLTRTTSLSLLCRVALSRLHVLAQDERIAMLRPYDRPTRQHCHQTIFLPTEINSQLMEMVHEADVMLSKSSMSRVCQIAIQTLHDLSPDERIKRLGGSTRGWCEARRDKIPGLARAD